MQEKVGSGDGGVDGGGDGGEAGSEEVGLEEGGEGGLEGGSGSGSDDEHGMGGEIQPANKTQKKNNQWRLSSGSNRQMHRLTKALMSLWSGHP